MIEVRYLNGLGNQLFQYCFGRILAESMGWQLKCAPLDGFPGTEELISGKSFEYPIIHFRRKAIVDVAAIVADPSPRRIVINAWVQKYEYFKLHRDRIRHWLVPQAQSLGHAFTPTPRDLLLHLRLGKDYEAKRWILAPGFYETAITAAKSMGNIYILFDSGNPVSEDILQSCLTPMLRFDPIIVKSKGALVDLLFVSQFQRIALAPSTFCWWSAFLSNATEIYFPDLRSSATSCWRSKTSWDFVRLEVDESRYINIPAKTLWDPE